MADFVAVVRIAGNAPQRARRVADMSDPGIRVVVVSHCSATTIEACLRHLLAAEGVAEVVVVDYGSDDGTVALATRIAQHEAILRVQAHPDNPGFAAGCNAGALGCTLPWLAFVNPDCYVETDTFAHLLAAIEGMPQIGMLGCVQVGADGVADAAVRRRDPSLRRILFARAARDALHVASDGSPLQCVDAISGALMLLPTAVFTQIGGFDAGYRLHAEDLDLCRRIRAAGYPVAIANTVRVTHLRGVSSRRRPLWVEWQKHRGMWRYFTKFEASSTALPMRGLLWVALWAHFLLLSAPLSWLRAARH